MKCRIVTAVVILGLAFYIHSLTVLLDLFKGERFYGPEACKRVEIDLPSEDMIKFGSMIVGATGDAVSMYYKHLGAKDLQPGKLIAIDPEAQTVENVNTIGFPSHLQMNAHGIALHNKNNLYVLSHSYAKGGEIVFVFELSENQRKIEAKFVKTISIGNDYGNYNGIAVVDSEHFYITQWIPFPDTLIGRDNSFFTGLKRTLLFSYTQTSGVKLCTVKGNKAECEFKAQGYIPNGILYHEGKLFFADSADKSVMIYQVKSDWDLMFVARVQIPHVTDNLHLHQGVIYVTGINKMIDYVLYSESVKSGGETHFVPSGASKLLNVGGVWKAEEVFMQNIISLHSQTVYAGDTMVLSSIIDPAIVFCKAVKG